MLGNRRAFAADRIHATAALLFEGCAMFGLLTSLTGLAADAVKVVAAPIEIAADLAGAVVKPVAKVAQELVADVKSLKD
jgi:hypothetical protein